MSGGDSSFDSLLVKLKGGEIDGAALGKLVEEGVIDKKMRRKLTRQAGKKELTERQKLRLEQKEKKALPKMSDEDRKRKFQPDLDQTRLEEAANFTTCLGCRKRGHFLKDCPFKNSRGGNTAEVTAPIVCFNCGSAEHTLKNCTKGSGSKSGKLQFATCFVCKKVGHISRDCPENANGLYPNGGCCHICMQKTHLVRDCPEQTEADRERFQLEKKQKEDERMYGVRVQGLTENDEGGDTLGAYGNEGGSDNDEDGEDGGGGGGGGGKKKGKKDKNKFRRGF